MKVTKKFFATLAVLVISLCTFSSCEDEDIAYHLEGTWKGNMHTGMMYENRPYMSTYTELEFLTDPFRFTKGDGYWVDYYSRAPWDYVANHFRWEVRDGIIYIRLQDYRYGIEYMEIRNYHLGDRYFTGEILSSSGTWTQFSLEHTSSPNWNSYKYGDYWYDDYYYSNTRSGDSTQEKPEAPRMFIGEAPETNE